MRASLKIWIKFSKFPVDIGMGGGNENVQDTQKGRNILDKSMISGKDTEDSILIYIY